MVVGGSAGGMIVPMIVGQLFESVGPLVMMYTILVDLVLMLLVYFVMIRHKDIIHRRERREDAEKT